MLYLNFSDSTIRKKDTFKNYFKWLKEGGVLKPIIEYAMQIKLIVFIRFREKKINFVICIWLKY